MMVLFALVSANTAKGQCDLAIANLVISPAAAPVQIAPGKCEYFFNASFDISTNSGFKYLFFHSWLATVAQNDYPNPPIFSCGGSTPAVNPGTATQLGTAVDQPGKSFLDFGFVGLKDFLALNPATTPTDITSLIATTYLHDPTVVLTMPSNSPGLNAKVTKTGNILHFDITNIRIVINGTCGGSIITKTDIWGSNSNAGDPKAQCYICGLGQSFNDPAISLLKICASSPFKYDIGIESSGTTTLNVTYKLYAHDPLLGNDPLPGDPLIYTSPVIQLNAGNSYKYDPAPIDLPAPYCCQGPWSDWDIYVKVSAAEFSNELSTPLISADCATLPVNLKYFTASRSRDLVTLKWETAQETDSKGFDVQRKVGNAGWTTVDFVASKAPGGNSNTTLSYEFVDYNNTKGITQYRLRQIDFDGTLAYSQIRSVRGEAQKGKTIVYPNPSGDGKVNIIFEDVRTTRDVQVIDMSGRTIKQWKALTNNNITIDNLNAGFYTVRIVDTETGEQVIEKFVVNKR